MRYAPKNIRAAFFDIDGTLTSFSTHEVPQSTLDALHALREQGIKLCICTGRAPTQMGIVLDALPIQFDAIAGLNGQYCWNDNGIIATHAISNTDVATIEQWLDDRPDIVATFSESDASYFNRDSPTLRRMWASLGKTAPPLEFHAPSERAAIYQISPYITQQQEDELVALCDNVRGVRWHPDFVDLIPADGGKNRGIEHIMRAFGFDPRDSIAFGDGGNDIDMLEFAGIGVAMGNATEVTKAAADYVTTDVDDNGIANALRVLGVL